MTPWTEVHQAPLPMGFSRQEYCCRLPFPPPGHLCDPGIECTSLALASRFFTIELPGEPCYEGLPGSVLSFNPKGIPGAGTRATLS